MQPELEARGTAKALARMASAPQFVARAFALAHAELRRTVLTRLIGSVGTLALAALGSGAFVKFVTKVRTVSIEDAKEASSEQVFELARYVQQADPDVIEQVLNVLLQDPSLCAAVGLSTAAMVGLLYRKSR